VERLRARRIRRIRRRRARRAREGIGRWSGSAPSGGPSPILRAGAFGASTAAVGFLALVGILPRWPGLVAEVGLPPLDQVADMRVLLARAPSPGIFALGVILDVLVRGLLLAWATGGTRRVAAAFRFVIASLLPAWVAAELSYSAQAILYSLLAWAGVAVCLLALLGMGTVPWSARFHKARATRGGSGSLPIRLLTLLGYFAALSVDGALVQRHGEVVEMAGLVASASLSVLAAGMLTGGEQRRRPSGGPMFSVAGSRALWVAALVPLALAPSMPASSSPSEHRGLVLRGSLLVVPGIDTSSGHGSAYLIRPQALGFDCARTYYFSYAGLGNGARRGEATCPIRSGAPYTREDTRQSLRVLVEDFEEEAARLPHPITVVTHSSGAWIAWDALASDPALAVRRMVLLAPLWGGIGYPSPGLAVPGAVGSAGMHLVVAIGRAIHFTTFEPFEPFARDLLSPPGASRALFEQALPYGVRVLAIQSWLDLAIVGQQPRNRALQVACPVIAAHGSVPEDPKAMAEARAFLDGQSQPPCSPFISWPGFLAAVFRSP
jgi:hypothetical protein